MLHERLEQDGAARPIDRKGLVPVDRNMHADRRVVAVCGLLEHVAECVADPLEGVAISVNGNTLSLDKHECSDVIDPMDVVRVGMRQYDGVQTVDVGRDALLAEVGARVDDNSSDAISSPALHEKRCSQTPVPGFVWVALAPIAVRPWNPGGRTATEHGEA